MKKRILFLLLTALLSLSIISVFAETIERPSNSDLTRFVTFYNDEVAGKSSMIDKIFGNEKINFYLDENLSFGIVTSKGRIIDQAISGIENPTLNVYITSNDLQDLINNTMTIEQALRSGKIKYEGATIFAKMKFGVIHLFQSWFLKNNLPKCIDSDGVASQDSSHIKGVCTDKDGKKFYDTCELIEPSNPNSKYKQLVDYDCNSEGYCEPVDWWCATVPEVYECESGACIPCPGNEPGCDSSSPFTDQGLSVPPVPELATLS